MIRSAAGKVMWVGRATVFLVGLAVILALTVGVVSRATAHAGSAGLFHLGHSNPVTTLSTLAGSVANGVLNVSNTSTASTATAVGAANKSAVSPAMRATNSGGGPALGLNVASGKAPMTVSRGAAKVANLDADKVDGKNSSSFANATHAHAGEAITSGTVAEGRIDPSLARDGEVMSTVQASDGEDSGLDADTLDGKHSSEFLTANQRLTTDDVAHGAGTITLNFESIAAQSCTDRTVFAERGTDLSNDVVAVTLGSNELLPLSFYTARSSTDSDAFRLVACNLTAASYDPPSSTYHWVAFEQPCANCEQIAAWESAAQSDLENAAAAAERCAADNGGYYGYCDTMPELESYGFSNSPGVVLTITAYGDRWIAWTQHVDGGSAYRYDNADGKIVPVRSS